MNNFPDSLRFELGKYIETFVRWLEANFSGLFDAISASLLWVMVHMENFLIMIPWWLVIIVIFVLGWRCASLVSGIVFALLMILVGSFGYWDFTMMTLAIVLASVFISLLFGIPIGIAMAYNRTTEAIMKPILDAMQTMPSFVYLIPAMIFFGLGKVPAVIATIIYAIPPVIRLTNLAIRRVSKDMVEAAYSYGSSPMQVLTKVQLPQALPTIMTGINQTTMMALAMVVIASMIGAQGLGMEVLIAINRVDIARGFEAGLGIVILAIIMDRISQGIAKNSQVKE
ncbi:proline/glycine betaine ABC transporter permease [Alkalihalobacillus sp. MEB130]|nr:proline/glycine betaine ABC transporter permease [Alkalihalobacillus sp. MEB130]MDT8861310.1 proline/glycine betaine ABC transporter permease [Alkalihalobacillus sp. MEB130]